jgi:hypothetical protein
MGLRQLRPYSVALENDESSGAMVLQRGNLRAADFGVQRL